MIKAQTELSSADSDLERRITTFLFGQHFADLRKLEVKADKGVVTIRGRVRSFHQRQLCINCCQRVAGVVDINDEISVAPASAS
jgi:osmotically-inducible protein OsmY